MQNRLPAFRRRTALSVALGGLVAGFCRSSFSVTADLAAGGSTVTVKVTDFGADPTGATDSTLAIEKAAAALKSGQTLFFPPGTYLVSYKWPPFSDSDPTTMRGRGHWIVNVVGKNDVSIVGPGATIKCVDHRIDAFGGFVFAVFKNSPRCSISGFRFDMSFTGWNTDAARYPLCGAVMAYDKYAGQGSQATLCSGFKAQSLTFRLFHPKGAFGITKAPYGGTDNNNGFKIITVFASGDSGATADENQERGLLVEDIHFEAGHNGYGCWGVSYNDATFRRITADAWSGASYDIAADRMTGANFVAVVRFYQYRCSGFSASQIRVTSRPWAQRTGAFAGNCGGIHFDSGLKDQTGGGGLISDCQFKLDAAGPGLTAVYDVGISSSASGNVEIKGNQFDAHSQAGVVCIYMQGTEGTGSTTYTVSGNTASARINGPFAQIVNVSAAGDANRTIKSVNISGNVINGWGSEGGVYVYKSAKGSYGAQNIAVVANTFDGKSSISPGPAINSPGRSAADLLKICRNTVGRAARPVVNGAARLVSDC